MLYLLDVSVDDRGLSLEALFTEWEKETEAVQGARSAGVVREAFKVAGDRRVLALIEAPSHDMLDDMLMGQLPLSHHIKINQILPLREYDAFAEALKNRFSAG
ncbi:MAG: muconolactone Delta-isomerase family protein [Pseudomonadota bacterium]